MKAKFEDIVDVTKIGTPEAVLGLSRVEILADNEEKKYSKLDTERVSLLLIDEQNDFISPCGELSVPGAVEDTERLCRFIYKFMYQIYRIHCTMDWHSTNHIFFPSAWVYGKDCIGADGNQHKAGEPVVPNTVITMEGIKAGDFETVLPNKNKALTYVKNVDKSKQNSGNNTPDELRIWNYHTQANTWGASLEGELNKIVTYHTIVRGCNPMYYYKGQDQYSEQYGAIEAEYSPENKVRLDILNILEDPQLVRLYFAGQAKSHCALRTLWQIVKYYANRPEILNKIWVLEDCMSCIPGFEAATEEKMEEMRQMGVHFIKSTEVTDLLMSV